MAAASWAVVPFHQPYKAAATAAHPVRRSPTSCPNCPPGLPPPQHSTTLLSQLSSAGCTTTALTRKGGEEGQVQARSLGQRRGALRVGGRRAAGSAVSSSGQAGLTCWQLLHWFGRQSTGAPTCTQACTKLHSRSGDPTQRSSARAEPRWRRANHSTQVTKPCPHLPRRTHLAQQVGASNQLVHGAEAQCGQARPHLLRHEVEVVDQVVGGTCAAAKKQTAGE